MGIKKIERTYCDFYDAYYGENNEWLEVRCSDPTCRFCISRPHKHPRDCACIEEYEEKKD